VRRHREAVRAPRRGLPGRSSEAAAAANPLNIPLSGPAANVVTRGYHLSAMSGNWLRVLTDWTLNTVTPPEATSFGVISAESVPLDVDNPRA
jgi:NADH:ubiquinone reductase (H+-translocating)